MPDPSPALQDRGWPAAFGMATIALVVAAFAVGTGVGALRDDDGSGGGGGGDGGGVKSVTVTLTEFTVSPDPIAVASGGTLVVNNGGSTQHNLTVEGHADVTTPMLNAGGSARLSLGGLADGSYQVLCTVPGHAEAGMRATLAVGDATPVAKKSMTPEEMDEAAAARTKAFPAKTKGLGGQSLQPTIGADGVKVFRITAAVTKWEVEPGRTVDAWTYNGTVPGPTIKVASGDKIRVVVTNKLPESTTMHFHGLDTPNTEDGVPDVTQPQIKSDETHTYAFTVPGPAVGMYHAHSNSQVQVPNGLAGAFLVGDLPAPAGRRASQELVMVLNDTSPVGFAINGKSFPATAPIAAKVGETFLVHYYNEGLQIHPMHLHGPRQTVIAKDGVPVPQPWTGDTILIAPGERYSVLVTPNRAGTWVWHCHVLTHAERSDGFFGMTTALVVT